MSKSNNMYIIVFKVNYIKKVIILNLETIYYFFIFKFIAGENMII